MAWRATPNIELIWLQTYDSGYGAMGFRERQIGASGVDILSYHLNPRIGRNEEMAHRIEKQRKFKSTLKNQAPLLTARQSIYCFSISYDFIYLSPTLVRPFYS